MDNIDNDYTNDDDIKKKFKDFLTERYKTEISDVLNTQKHRLIVNIDDIREEDPDLAQNLINHPIQYLPLFEDALQDAMQSVSNYNKDEKEQIHIAIDGILGDQKLNPRQLEASKFGKLICIEGIVTKASLVHPKLIKSVQYNKTNNIPTVRDYSDQTMLGTQTNTISTLTYPTKTADGIPLKTRFGFCEYRNYQTITIQEMPESSPLGQLPRSVDIYLNDDLVDRAKPGDRVQVYGIYKSLCNRSASIVASGSFKSVILANNIQVIHMNNAIPKSTATTFNKIRELSKREDIFELLTRSIAPSIKGHMYIKQALLLLLLGGQEHILENQVHLRGDINVLLVGDPSCGKSQFLRFILNTAPLAVNTTGKGSSGVGLTAAVVRDPETGERRIEGGAFVLADRGIICIDEFDKMLEKDRVAIHEVMEQQSITISKGGIYCSLNARCSVLAAANPVYGQYDISKSPQDNIGLPDSLLSRFDLLFIVRDEIDSEKDREIASHVLSMHQYINKEDDTDSDSDDENAVNDENIFVRTHDRNNHEEILNVQFLKQYIQFAKERQPELTDESEQYISDSYSQLRQRSDIKTLPITVRVLESLIRIATAHAKCRLSKTVDIVDCESALDIVSYSLYHDAKPSKKSDLSDEENEFEIVDTDISEEEEDHHEDYDTTSHKRHNLSNNDANKLMRTYEDDDEDDDENTESNNDDNEENNNDNDNDNNQYLDIDKESEEYLLFKQKVAAAYKQKNQDHLTTQELIDCLHLSDSFPHMKILAFLDTMDEEGVIMKSDEDTEVTWFKV